MRRLTHAIKDDSLSIVLFALFAICISAQSFAGWRLQNETIAAHGRAAVGYWHNLSTGTFLEGLATNWPDRLSGACLADRVQRPPKTSEKRD